MRLLLGALALVFAAPAGAQPIEALSPDGSNRITLQLSTTGTPVYTVSRGGAAVLAPSPILLDLDQDSLGYGLAITGSEAASADTRYPIVAGKAAEGRDHYNQRTVHFQERGGARRKMDVVLRAYDDGVAFRTVIPVQAATAAAIVRYERTGFYFPSAYKCWGFNVGKFGSSHEGEFDPVDTTRTRDHNLFDLPFVCETGKAAFALAEADLLDFAGMYLTGRGDGGLGLQVKLSPSLDDSRDRGPHPRRQPDRHAVARGDARRPAGQIQQSTLLTDLSSPSRVEDTSWIKPGLASWDWWNGPVIAKLPGQRTTTDVAKAFIDFSAGQRLPLRDDRRGLVCRRRRRRGAAPGRGHHPLVRRDQPAGRGRLCPGEEGSGCGCGRTGRRSTSRWRMRLPSTRSSGSPGSRSISWTATTSGWSIGTISCSAQRRGIT
jgi:alpha-glucosidase